MPSQGKFHDLSGYFATLFHELSHSTLHETRCNRQVKPFEMEERSKEELCAEIGASFLCAAAGIDNATLEENTTAYIVSWLKH
jgi:antirestriction protein ArdC